MDKRNLDIAKVSKASSRGQRHDKRPQHKPVHHTVPSRMGYWKLIGKSWRAVFDANIFQLALLRNLLGLRSISIILVPIVYFQLRYLLILKPDQVLTKVKSYVSPQNTTNLILLGGVFMALLLISFIADSIISPALIRYQYQRLGSRRPKMSQSIKQSMSLSFVSVSQRLLKSLILIINLSVSLMIIYFAYILGYGSVERQITYLLISFFILLVQYSLYFNFKYWLQASLAIGYTQGRSKLAMAIKQTMLHPISSLGYGINWLKSILVILLLNLVLVWGVIYLIELSGLIWQQILILAIFSTLVYLIWSVWTCWQAGYWSAIVEYKSQAVGLSFASIEESKTWQFLSLIIILFIIIGSYIVISYLFSDKIISLLDGLNSKIPSTIKVNLPKP